MLGRVKLWNRIATRSFKNFGHKNEPEALITVLWSGFLTFSFIGVLINWKWVGSFFAKHSTENSEESVDSENAPSNR